MPLNFASERELRKHTKRHWQEFNLTDENAHTDYLALARIFCEGPCPAGTEECIRKCDNMIDRFCDKSAEFAVLMPMRMFIRTFHILHPFGTPGIAPERTHRFATNREYYDADCECRR
jgi:hypothetical protein